MRLAVTAVAFAIAMAVTGAIGLSCYKPSLRDCAVACATASDCAGGQVCGVDGMCASPAVAGTCASIASMQPDADSSGGDDDDDGGHDAATGRDARVDAPQHDARLSDAASPQCGTSCPGTCQGNTCVIDCSAKESCPGTTRCPPGVPCQLTCGDGACKNIDCSQASSCTAECSGAHACEKVTCGSGACEVTCSGDHACRTTDCHDSCACEIDCTGDMACKDRSTCPAGCSSGEGCTSSGTCDRC